MSILKEIAARRRKRIKRKKRAKIPEVILHRGKGGKGRPYVSTEPVPPSLELTITNAPLLATNIIFGEATQRLRGTKGTVTLADGRRIPKIASKITKELLEEVRGDLKIDLERLKRMGAAERERKRWYQWLKSYRQKCIDAGMVNPPSVEEIGEVIRAYLMVVPITRGK